MEKSFLLTTAFSLVIMMVACTPQTHETPITPSVDTTSATDTAPKISQPLAKQKITMASGDTEKWRPIMEKLIGEWHSMPENYSEEGLAWMKENGISDYYDTFGWGTNKAWIDFGDYRVKDGKVEKTGVGMISWHTGFKHLRFRESGARGGLVDGMIEIKDENTFARHYEFFTPEGEIEYYSDSWTFDPTDLNCFIWQPTTYTSAEPKTHPGRKYCKK